METEKKEKKYTLAINEQETHISYMRDQPFAMIYTSDSTQITKFNRLCKNSPDMYQLIEEGSMGNRYLCKDKTLVRYGSKKRTISEEQKKAFGERMRVVNNEKKNKNDMEE